MPVLTQWHPRQSWSSLPPQLVSWLREKESLTQRGQRSFAHFAVKPVFQGDARSLLSVMPSESRILPVREVLLLGNGEPFIFAHSVLSGAPRGPLSRWLRGLGSRSLGSLLFRLPGFRRQALMFRRLDPRDVLYQACLTHLPASSIIRQSQPPLWARCCEHRFGQQSIWVAEVFLNLSLYGVLPQTAFNAATQ